MVFHNTDVILISDKLYYDFEKYVPHDKVHYCTNGIPEYSDKATDDRLPIAIGKATDPFNPEKAHDSGRKTHGIYNETCNLLFLSNLFTSKGTFILLDACRLLKDKNLKFHCTYSGGEGDITSKQFISKVNELGLGDCVTYEGMRLGDEKKKVFSEADIFVHPSYSDCLPLVILEAMQNSLPVVSTIEGAIPDAVEDGVSGFLVPVKHPAALAEKLEILINDSDLRWKMGEEGRKRYEQKFRLEIFENRLHEILLKSGRKIIYQS
jgi:glycosyltransferase involved in cell wall biosynthesis